MEDPSIRDFIVMYIAEGAKKARNVVDFTNTDATTIKLFLTYIPMFSDKKIKFRLFYRENIEVLLEYWSATLCIEKDRIVPYKKVDSAKKGHRSSVYGTMKVTVSDTYAKQRIDALCDYLKKEWTNRFLPLKGRVSKDI